MPRFKIDDHVRIIECAHLTGLTGTVLGVASRAGVNEFLIIGFDRPLPSGHRAVTIMDAQLEYADKNAITLTEKYAKALKECIARAGWTDSVEACRLVIETAEEALYGNNNPQRNK